MQPLLTITMAEFIHAEDVLYTVAPSLEKYEATVRLWRRAVEMLTDIELQARPEGMSCFEWGKTSKRIIADLLEIYPSCRAIARRGDEMFEFELNSRMNPSFLNPTLRCLVEHRKRDEEARKPQVGLEL